MTAAPDRRTEIARHLSAGLGADDIEVRHGISADDVRSLVRRMRALGYLRPEFFAPLQPRSGRRAE